MMKILIIFCSLFFYSNAFTTKKIASDLGIVWGMTFISEKELLFTQKNGTVGVLNIDSHVIKSIKSPFNIFHKGQGGLLDVQVSPSYKKDGWIYFTYVTDVNKQGATTLSRVKLKENALVNLERLLVSQSATPTGAHFGSRITFDEEEHLYFSIGDRGVRSNAQNLTNHAGSILRLNLDGSIPKDNPFINNPNALDEIYSYGHRNPQGLFYDKNSQKLYSIEHGPRGGDEINVISKAANYGWPIISYGKEYWGPLSVGEGTHKEGMEQPLKVYVPSIAPSSLIVYSGKIFKELKGHILSGALKLRHLNQIILDAQGNVIKENRLFTNLDERIRNVIESPRGYLYLSTDQGNIYKITP